MTGSGPPRELACWEEADPCRTAVPRDPSAGASPGTCGLNPGLGKMRGLGPVHAVWGLSFLPQDLRSGSRPGQDVGALCRQLLDPASLLTPGRAELGLCVPGGGLAAHWCLAG